MQNLSSDSTPSSRDLLQRFMEEARVTGGGSEKGKEVAEIELNLGLSLGGRFGVEKNPMNLARSSSIAAFFPSVKQDAPPEAASNPRLGRTSSLPVETEEDWRKRKELQSLRRMQAKRRRSEKEKQKNLRGEKDSVMEDEKKDIEKNLKGKLKREQYVTAAKRFGLSAPPQPGRPTWVAAAAGQAAFGGGRGRGGMKGKRGNSTNLSKAVLPSSQGSGESQGGSSSSMSEFESKSLQGPRELSPGSLQSKDVNCSGVKAMNLGSRPGTETESSSSKPESASGKAKKTGGLEEMPCVFTKGDGPNGRRVDGILYKYGKGQEVRIMCVCHGSFLSPAEFVRHAGGTDVSNPLRHIVVNPNSSQFT
ncbi:unnamed protein product [Cuscuta epithymum]|uniref:Ninja-family protein n=1 Tax=Cuscuta epithymum TaxID=186058 RepID=A0AAV0EL89_9ASTE|nr:unnamed protein product [Cuscuta epithymum]CAH9123982.1 unnamed protein product [Cuscuta epithymum]